MTDVLDLDALMPPEVTIKFGDVLITIKPPRTADVLRLGYLGQKLEGAEELSEQELDKVVDDLTNHMYKCIPELANKDFNTAQLLKLVEIISEMAVPPDAKELKKRGITVDSDPKAQ